MVVTDPACFYLKHLWRRFARRSAAKEDVMLVKHINWKPTNPESTSLNYVAHLRGAFWACVTQMTPLMADMLGYSALPEDPSILAEIKNEALGLRFIAPCQSMDKAKLLLGRLYTRTLEELSSTPSRGPLSFILTREQVDRSIDIAYWKEDISSEQAIVRLPSDWVFVREFIGLSGTIARRFRRRVNEKIPVSPVLRTQYSLVIHDANVRKC
jgi:hypothetical protein